MQNMIKMKPNMAWDTRSAEVGHRIWCSRQMCIWPLRRGQKHAKHKEIEAKQGLGHRIQRSGTPDPVKPAEGIWPLRGVKIIQNSLKMNANRAWDTGSSEVGHRIQ